MVSSWTVTKIHAYDAGHHTDTLRVIGAVAGRVLLVAVLGVALDARVGIAREDTSSDCLVAVEDGAGAQLAGTIRCTDCDPTCDREGAAGADGACVFRVRGCVNVPGVGGCLPRPIKRVRFKAQRGKTPILPLPSVDPGEASSVCGAFVDLRVSTRKGGRKAGKVTVVASAQANVKPTGRNKDVDTITFVCMPRTAAEACPTTTTTTTSTTTTLAPVCGNGAVDVGEQCDPPGSSCGGAMLCGGDGTCPCDAAACPCDFLDPSVCL